MQILIHIVVIAIGLLGGQALTFSQTTLSFGEQQPFVVGVVPVVGNGVVGGVAVDATGVVEQAVHREVVALQTARRKALTGVAGDVTEPSKLRKISLRRLDSLLAQHVSQQKPLPAEVLTLAGLLPL